MTTLRLDDFLGEERQTGQGWRPYGCLGNPFPSRSHPVWDVFHNQAAVLQRFYVDLREFVGAGTTTTMFFTGGNRIGKTHFCEYHRLRLPDEFSRRGLVIPIAVVSAESCKFSDLYRGLIDQLEESLLHQTGHGFFAKSWIPRLRDDLQPIGSGDYRQATTTLLAAEGDDNFNAMHALLASWMRGARLRLPERTRLGVASVIESLGHELNVLEGLVSTVRAVETTEGRRCPGIMVFVDEFELIWTYRRDRRDRFLQALRALVDACPNGVFLCVAMATGVGYQYDIADLEAEYPALFARLKGARDVPALVEVPGVVEAQEYAKAFLDSAREKARQAGVPEGQPLFTGAEIASMFLKVSGGMGTASQGDFFDMLHTEAERRAGASVP